MFMSKQKFIEAIDKLFQVNEVGTEVLEYFNSTVKAKKVNKKELEKSQIVKDAIQAYLVENSGKYLDRVEIGNELYNRAEFSEEYLLNEKGTVAYNSITAFANQLVTEGIAQKEEIKIGKVKKVKYVIKGES